jgi:N-hydroxyarylamine O-acetyltransferase
MLAERMKIASEYLERIGYGGPLKVTADTLCGLHLAHMCSVPFENLDIQTGHAIALDEAALFDKIVIRRRGGFCYELNGLFAALLRECGFRVGMLSAEVAQAAGGFSPPFDHLALRVDLEEPWLADVGFGDGFRAPLRLQDFGEQAPGGSAYRIETDGRYRVVWRRDGDQAWQPQYRFTLAPHELAEFAQRCRFHQTSPESHFTQNRICTLATPEGRITISGMRLIVTRGGVKTERLLAGPEEYRAVLREQFGVLE